MALLPKGGALTNEPSAVEQQTSSTFRLDPEGKRIIGMVDGLEAVKQAVLLILSTERFQHVIYSFNHGSELQGLTGNHASFVASEVKRRIREALLQDDRIQAVENFQISVDGDTLLAVFTVVSIYGSFEEKKEVNRRV